MDNVKNRIDSEDIIKLVENKIDFFKNEDCLQCEEIGDGNVNYVFRVYNDKNQSVIVKYADTYIRNSDTRMLSTKRSSIEYEILKVQDELCPNSVPKVYYFDDELSCIIMEDLKDYNVMRESLINYEIFPSFADQISSFLYHTLFKTTDLVMSPDEKKRLSESLTNVDMCEISERLVFTEPYKNFQDLNNYHVENEDFVRKELYENENLIFEIGKLKDRFKNYGQSMIHGDLHTGSIFINKEETRVFDPEFAFYGPMGYDIGNIIGNLILSWVSLTFIADPEENDFFQWIEGTVENIIDFFIDKYNSNYDQDVMEPMAKNEIFKQYYLLNILSDTAAYAGTEIIRRTVGVAKVKEIEMVIDDKVRPNLERILLNIGKDFILKRNELKNGSEFVGIVKQNIVVNGRIR